jgi:hypothetical protein
LSASQKRNEAPFHLCVTPSDSAYNLLNLAELHNFLKK